MKKLRLLFCLLVVVCIIASSSTFSAMPQGKFPIQIYSDRPTPNNFEKNLIIHLEKAFNNSSKFRISHVEENRIMLGILANEYIPGVISTDVLASASPVNVYSLVWSAKPKNKHAYVIWHGLGRFESYAKFTQIILEDADVIVWKIKNQCPYVFD
jgi:hypothetical protein